MKLYSNWDNALMLVCCNEIWFYGTYLNPTLLVNHITCSTLRVQCSIKCNTRLCCCARCPDCSRSNQWHNLCMIYEYLKMYFTIAVLQTRNHCQQAHTLVSMDINKISHIPAPVTSVPQVPMTGKLSVILILYNGCQVWQLMCRDTHNLCTYICLRSGIWGSV